MLAVKEHQEQRHTDVVATLRSVEEDGWRGVSQQQHREVTKAHGRIEPRDAWLIQEAEYRADLNPQHRWAGLRAIGMVATERRDGTTVPQKRRYYIVGGRGDGAACADATRQHWGIEKQAPCWAVA